MSLSAATTIVFLSVTALPAGAQEQGALTAELVAGGGLAAGDQDAAREALLAAVEADPTSPLVAEALSEIARAAELCRDPLDPRRLVALVPEVRDGHASLLLRRELLDQARRARFSDAPFVPEGDLFADLVSEWRLLGPLGALDHPEPLRAPLEPDGPVAELAATHRAADGTSLAWRPLRRERNQLAVAPRRHLWPDAGVGYLLAFLRADVAEAVLEVHAREPGPVQVFWNGRQVLDVLRRDVTGRGDRFLARVPVQPGWNALLLRFPVAQAEALGARLLAATPAGAGIALSCEEAPAEGPLPPWTPVSFEPQSPAPPEPASGWEGVLAMLRAVGEGRPDIALAAGAPADGDARLRAAWLRARHRALREAIHLPAEVQRRSQIEVETELEALGALPPAAWLTRIRRLTQEDQLAHALAQADAMLAAAPDSVVARIARVRVLEALDETGVLARAELEALLSDHPRHPTAANVLSDWRETDGDAAGALDLAWRALALDGSDHDSQERVLRLATRAGGEHLARLRERLDAWRAEEPGNPRVAELRDDVFRRTGDQRGREASLREQRARLGGHPGATQELAAFLVSRGREAEALELLDEQLARDPGQHWARFAAAYLGRSDPAQRFFQELAPDREEALAAARGAGGASVVEALDSGMVYLFPDGSSRQRFHTLTVALDRKGTELLHEAPVAPETRLARVLKADGRTLEPVDVDDTWVMPSLEPGDAVELVVERFTRGLRGVAPDLGWWRFASFEKPFVRSRYVLYVPDGLPGELRAFHPDWEHEERRWGGGTVHVFLASDQPRRKEEPLRPSYEEILPWVQYGADREVEPIAASWRRRLEYLSGLPADVEGELAAVVAAVAAELDPAATAHERARALYERVTQRVLEFDGPALASHAWTLRRGDPICLFAALYELAGIPFEWAVLESAVAPELEPEPVRAFAFSRGFTVPAIRLAAEDGGEPVWQLRPAGRGARFGAIPDETAGVRALVLGADGPRMETLPRDQLERSWDLDLDVAYALDSDGAAGVAGRVAITSAEGAVVRERLSQLGAVEREGAARQLAARLVAGLDLTDFDFPGLEESGGPFVLAFRGRIPRFVRSSGDEHLADLRLPPSGLSTGLGAADRTWPLAFRASSRARARVRVELGDAWRVAGAPAPFQEEREGFVHALDVERDESTCSATRTLIVRGLVLAPEEVGPFLTREAELEREEARPLRLERVE